MTQFENAEFTRLAEQAGNEADDAKRVAILKITRLAQDQAFTNRGR